ncbi:phosphoribosylanthranilate isomerase [Roseomonas sp. KE2513]|uniref:phosphoribosylanthranilate isomerase n=1 Tax=Roseomonas sp. KE2513 TaxID=2479202 RepID=UPI0018DF2455|nr:phosphoribosylanthranilate isomerase [Roseomonas sp. KE2513]MBI0534703.1 phosphoribosylanthranilate isomerase [Roseomonas sp. KE2513]
MAAVKICGLSDRAGLDAAVAGGAEMIGLVFFPASPRAVTAEQAAALLAEAPAKGGPLRVGLFVDASDERIGAVLESVPLDLLQLHGEETPARCAALRARFGRPVMKALGIASDADVALLDAYAPVVDRFLLDAKPAPGAALPGGNAAAFDWSLLAGRQVPRPWLLAGGLTPENVAEAVRATGAPGVDVSSGVEASRGVKDPARIAAFIRAAHGAEAAGRAKAAGRGG